MPKITIILLDFINEDQKPIQVLREDDGVQISFNINSGDIGIGYMYCSLTKGAHCSDYQRNILHIENFEVDKKYRRQGYGSLLLKYACAFAASEQLKLRIYTESPESDLFFKHFFERYKVVLGCLPQYQSHLICKDVGKGKLYPGAYIVPLNDLKKIIDSSPEPRESLPLNNQDSQPEDKTAEITSVLSFLIQYMNLVKNDVTPVEHHSSSGLTLWKKSESKDDSCNKIQAKKPNDFEPPKPPGPFC